MTPALTSRSALLCLLPGLGDAFAASSLIRRLRASGYTVDVLAMLNPVGEYARSLREIERVVVLPLLDDPRASIGPLVELRRRRYDITIVPFPATRWQYASVARFIGRGTIAIHDYGGLSRLLMAGRRAVLQPLCGGHRFWENDRLADALGLEPENADDREHYLLPTEWYQERVQGTLGVHPGTMVYKGNEARRWAFERFVELVASELRIEGRVVRVFFGPNEQGDRAKLEAAVAGKNLHIVSAPLDEAAQALARCEVFVGNDAGFSHLAAGLGVKTLVLFGMTDPVRATPLGRASALRPSLCPPCHDEGMGGFECVRNIGYQCLTDDLSVEAVRTAVEALFRSELPPYNAVRSGPFRLYGRPHEPSLSRYQ